MANKVIETLTPEQEVKLEEYYQEWLTLSYRTDPLTIEEMREPINKVYKTLNLPAPKIYLVNGPLEIVQKAKELGDNRKPQEIKSELNYGAWEFYWLQHYNFGRELDPNLYDPADNDELDAYLELVRHSHILLCYEECVIAAQRPTALHVDEPGRLHCENGPALAFSDNLKLYMWHDVTVPDFIIEKPETITVQHIEKEENAEVRRVMIERYGQDRYISDSGSKIIHKDTDPKTKAERVLYRKELPNDEAMVMVKVINSTPEPDGHFKEYMIRVPPTTKTCGEAVAWTFGLTEPEYAPLVQT